MDNRPRPRGKNDVRKSAIWPYRQVPDRLLRVRGAEDRAETVSMLKRFKIIADRYRNRRRRFALRLFLIAAIYNKELQLP
jgi:hypothetical protein